MNLRVDNGDSFRAREKGGIASDAIIIQFKHDTTNKFSPNYTANLVTRRKSAGARLRGRARKYRVP